jgi:hypothetical protein
MTHWRATCMTVPVNGAITGLCFRAIVDTSTRSSDPPQVCLSVAKNPPTSAGTMVSSDRVSLSLDYPEIIP